MAFDSELVARYDTHGPRYTSYPTAAQFHAGFGTAHYLEAVEASNDEPIPRDLSLYVHLPFCNSACWYCACHRSITHRDDRARSYLSALYEEIVRKAAHFDRDRLVRQLHFGGGTPTFYSLQELADILRILARAFSFAPSRDCELGIEIDPRSVSPEEARDLARLGFDRFSLGVQDFDPRVQRAINRRQSIGQVRGIVDAVRKAGAGSVSFDLIYGLPHQTPQRFARTLKLVAALQPDRVSVYAYAHMPERFPLQSLMPADALPDSATRLRMLQLCHEYLGAEGYRAIGLDHFVRPSDPLMRAFENGTLQRNFQGYSTHGGCDLIGLGASAISSIGDVYAQNETDIRRWQATLQTGELPIARGLRLNADDRLRRDVIQDLMCRGHVDTAAVAAEHGLDFWRYFADALAPLEAMSEDGLLVMDAGSLRITEKGRLLMRNVAMVFDAYAATSPQKRFSQVI
ncbi:oxygen-independent coproporphyrinogen III oxidase [Algiphilus aromaticivorans]|uniref:oxygen-independent coproporphyrinogen III oxidase n=1 Tax=Algiphilus aromaticivorans TaxID=382454 RepID=UPI0005C12B38|nr:oxygen-independent coproporphyrinogen III oxidase [Algiphilus aromaticivorans]